MQMISRLITPPGWIASAKMYTLIAEGGAVYLINTGRAANPRNLHSELGRYHRVAAIIQSKYDPDNAKIQARIEAGERESLLDGKKSRRFSLGEIEEMSVENSFFKGDYILMKAGGEKYILTFHRTRKAEAEAFVKAAMGH